MKKLARGYRQSRSNSRQPLLLQKLLPPLQRFAGVYRILLMCCDFLFNLCKWAAVKELNHFILVGRWKGFRLKFPGNPLLFSHCTVNPFPADVAIKRHLGSAPKSHVCDRENWSDWLVWPNDSFLLTWGVYIANRRKEHSMFLKNTLDWLKTDSVDQNVTRVWEFFTRRWNAWHWESHCVFTAGGGKG
jgi:hypothetical protein